MITTLTSDGGQSPLNRILYSLKDEHRRYLLYHLQEEEPSDLDEAARHVAARDYGCDPVDVPPKMHGRIKSELYHIHIPKLENMNIIDYNDHAQIIQYSDPPNKLDSFIDFVREEEEFD